MLNSSCASSRAAGLVEESPDSSPSGIYSGEMLAASSEPALSLGPDPGPVHCWTFSSLSHGEDDIPRLGARLELEDASPSLRADVLRPSAH
eukprot:superscaffoldBa00001483_g10755